MLYIRIQRMKAVNWQQSNAKVNLSFHAHLTCKYKCKRKYVDVRERKSCVNEKSMLN